MIVKSFEVIYGFSKGATEGTAERSSTALTLSVKSPSFARSKVYALITSGSPDKSIEMK